MSEDDLPRLVSRMFKVITAIIVASFVISICTLTAAVAGLIYLFFQWT
jgi:hypothetical protein